MRILFITATRLGDAVLSTGLLRHLLDRYPTARFTIACGPVAADVFARMPRRDRTVIVTKRRFDAHWLKLWADLVGTQFDLVIDLRGSALSFFLRAGKRAIMRGGRRPGHRLTHIAGVLNVVPAPRPVAFFDAADLAAADAILPAGKMLIGLGATANWPEKIWPAENFVAFYQELTRDMPDAVPVVFGGPGEYEAQAAAPVLAALPNAMNCVGRLPLPAVAAALSRLRLFVGNDSGLMHLAASAATPTLGLFGPTSAEEYAPAGPYVAHVVADGVAGQAPMRDLSVEKVLFAAKDLLARPPLRGAAV